MKDRKIAGWYYDLQKENDLTSIKLLANTIVSNEKTEVRYDKEGKPVLANKNNEEDKEGKYIKKDTIKLDEMTTESERYGQGADWRKLEKTKDGDKEWWEEDSDGYNKLLCRSILTEDFNITTTNAWTDFGNDPLGQAWESIAKPLAPYATIFKNGLNALVEKQNNRDTSRHEKGVVTKTLEKITNFMSEFANNTNIDEYLNKSLVVQGTRFTYYSGTGIAFNNLGMRFTVFPRWVGNKFISVTEQVVELYPYVLGRFVDFNIDNTTVSNTIEGLIKYVDDKVGAGGSLSGSVKDSIRTVQDFAHKFANWQEPPGGYKAVNKDIDQVQEGTLKLKIGGLYAITNLVCSDASFTFSKQMVKSPTGGISPLYCDINLMLKPATKYSNYSLKKFVDGSSMSDDKKKIINDMKIGLKGAKENNDV